MDYITVSSLYGAKEILCSYKDHYIFKTPKPDYDVVMSNAVGYIDDISQDGHVYGYIYNDIHKVSNGYYNNPACIGHFKDNRIYNHPIYETKQYYVAYLQDGIIYDSFDHNLGILSNGTFNDRICAAAGAIVLGFFGEGVLAFKDLIDYGEDHRLFKYKDLIIESNNSKNNEGGDGPIAKFLSTVFGMFVIILLIGGIYFFMKECLPKEPENIYVPKVESTPKPTVTPVPTLPIGSGEQYLNTLKVENTINVGGYFTFTFDHYKEVIGITVEYPKTTNLGLKVDVDRNASFALFVYDDTGSVIISRDEITKDDVIYLGTHEEGTKYRIRMVGIKCPPTATNSLNLVENITEVVKATPGISNIPNDTINDTLKSEINLDAKVLSKGSSSSWEYDHTGEMREFLINCIANEDITIKLSMGNTVHSNIYLYDMDGNLIDSYSDIVGKETLYVPAFDTDRQIDIKFYCTKNTIYLINSITIE